MTDLPLSDRVQRIKPSPTLAVTARAAELRAAGQDVIGLGAGEPDFNTPAHIRQAAKQAIDAGQTRYTAVDGTPALKDAIIGKFARDNDLHYERSEILVSSGAKQSIFNLCQALLDPDDEVLIPAPYWVSYPDMVLLAGARPVVLGTAMDQDFKLSPGQLAAAITPRSRLLILNSPSNPSGKAYTRAELAALGEVLQAHPRLMVLTDDIYEHILWTGQPFVNLVNAVPTLKSRTIVVNGVSKAYAMTGWRIGYAAGPGRLVAAMKKIQSQSTSNPCSISQAAATAALTGDQQCIEEMNAQFRARHDRVVERLNELPGVRCLPSDGTFYAFPCFNGVLERLPAVADDVALGEHLLERAQVALVPGSAFGSPGHMRLSYATGMDQLDAALDRIAQALPG
ncbi:MAG TPA: pyridoxal phosphate-dependent aminotransferase [Gammaproteobacteria bacterium]|nr:pyridoxal phosphate-dependent aminotransferase [Gammaproteobacteria bacterium]